MCLKSQLQPLHYSITYKINICFFVVLIMCTTAYCICVAIVGTMCLVITDNVQFDAKSVQIITKSFNDHLGLLRPLFKRLS